MTYLKRLVLTVAVLLILPWVVQLAQAAEPPADLCSLLPAGDLSKTLGQNYDAPTKSVAPRPFPNTVEGADCVYKKSKDSGKVLFRAYADPSPAAAADLFARLAKFYSPPTPVSGVGDQAYYDKRHGLHVLKGRVRFFLEMDGLTPSAEKQLTEVARQIAGKL